MYVMNMELPWFAPEYVTLSTNISGSIYHRSFFYATMKKIVDLPLYGSFIFKTEIPEETMKINQVEELVGITKKNIRFYEDQGLLKPERNPNNGYREYSLEDVKQLERIKLLRQLDVPCSQIRKLMDKEITLKECMEHQVVSLHHQQRNFQIMEEMCRMLEEDPSDFEEITPDIYLEKMNKLEKGGVSFMDVQKSDVKSRKTGAILAAVFMVVMMVGIIGLVLWANTQDPIPNAAIVFIVLVPVVIIGGVLLALYQRMKELKGGEQDEANKY